MIDFRHKEANVFYYRLRQSGEEFYILANVPIDTDDVEKISVDFLPMYYTTDYVSDDDAYVIEITTPKSIVDITRTGRDDIPAMRHSDISIPQSDIIPKATTMHFLSSDNDDFYDEIAQEQQYDRFFNPDDDSAPKAIPSSISDRTLTDASLTMRPPKPLSGADTKTTKKYHFLSDDDEDDDVWQ